MGEMMLTKGGFRGLLAILLMMLLSAGISFAETTRAVNFIRFATNGMDVVIDLPGLEQALVNGADPNWIDREHKRHESTLSHFVMLCSFSRNRESEAPCLKSLKLLVLAGAKLQPIDRGILFFPVAQGKTDIASLLLDIGADAAKWPNAEIGTPLSPIEYAVKSGNQQVVDLLVAHGATKPSERDTVQLRFIEAAKSGSPDLVQELLRSGAKANTKGRDGEVALIHAMEDPDPCRGYKKALILFNAGADPNIHGKSMMAESTTPLHQAVWFTSFVYVRKENPSCVEMLLSELIARGAHISSVDSDGRTPLHVAAEQDHIYAARVLLEGEAKVMPRDKAGRTPLDLATSGPMIKLLKNYGATER